ncbi:MAG: hypothetical protein ACFE85_10885 [Candidatus Hodarchaeota archaeon]
MSSSVDEIYQKLIEKGLSEEEIDHQMHKKAQQYGGFMSKQGILFIIAKEHGIKLYSPEIDPEIYKEIEEGIDYDEFAIPISNVQEGMQNIVLLGTIIDIFQGREFVRKDGSAGKVGSFILGDIFGKIKVVLWDDKVEMMDNEYFNEGEIIRIIGGYSKLGNDNSLEVHIGRKGTIHISPNDISLQLKNQLESVKPPENYYSNLKREPKKNIQDLVDAYDFIRDIRGIVQIDEFKEVNTKSGERAFLLKLVVTDDSASIHVIIWGMPAVECLKLINDGDAVHITNLKVQKNTYNNEKELIFTKKSSLQIIG